MIGAGVRTVLGAGMLGLDPSWARVVGNVDVNVYQGYTVVTRRWLSICVWRLGIERTCRIPTTCRPSSFPHPVRVYHRCQKKRPAVTGTSQRCTCLQIVKRQDAVRIPPLSPSRELSSHNAVSRRSISVYYSLASASCFWTFDYTGALFH